MGGATSRRKGHTYERRIATLFRESFPEYAADIKRSLQFISEHGAAADSATAKASAAIFLRTEDSDTRRFCLASLSRMTNAKAKTELLRLSQLKDLDQPGKDLIISHLNGLPQTPPIAFSGQKPNSSRADQ